MISDAEIAWSSLSAQRTLLKERSISSTELVQIYRDRINSLDDSLRAYITICDVAADARARTLDEARETSGKPNGLWGIPLAVKDQMAIENVRVTGGSHLFRERIPTFDATVIARLRSADAILLGTLNTMEFHMAGTRVFPFGTPRNPWDLTRTPGGSSCGSGIAVAAGLCSAALGADTGGSIRLPASMCGITGLKPTWSRVSRFGVNTHVWSMDCVGPMARSAEDCALLLDVLGGHDHLDPTSSHRTMPQSCDYLNGSINGVRIGLVSEAMEVAEASTQEAVALVLETLAGLGAKVTKVSLPMVQETRFVTPVVVDSEAASYHRSRLIHESEGLDRNTRVRLLVGSCIPAGLQTLAARARAAMARQVLHALESVDILVGPTCPGGAGLIADPPVITSHTEATSLLYGRGRAEGTAIYSMAGVPAITVPCGFDTNRMPLGCHLAGRYFDEPLLLRVAHAYQLATDWHTRRPKLLA